MWKIVEIDWDSVCDGTESVRQALRASSGGWPDVSGSWGFGRGIAQRNDAAPDR